MNDTSDQITALRARVDALNAEIVRLRQGLAIIRADYPEVRDVATATLWPMEKGGEA